MKSEREAIEFDELVSNAAAVFEEIEHRHEGAVVRREGKLYVLRPKTTHRRKRAHFSESDGLFQLAGAGASVVPTDVRHHKDEYLAEAYLGETPG